MRPCRKDYDYSKSGKYFITICTEKKLELFWDDKNELNEAGLVVAKHLGKLQEKLKVFIDCYAVMPNHVHAIIEIKDQPAGGHKTQTTHVGSGPCARPNEALTTETETTVNYDQPMVDHMGSTLPEDGTKNATQISCMGRPMCRPTKVKSC